MFILIQKQGYNMIHHDFLKKISCIIWAVFFIACNKRITIHNNTTHYSELDVIKLNGLHVLAENDKYPYVTIENVDSTKKIINYYFQKSNHRAEVYLYDLKENAWICQENFASDTGKVLLVKKNYNDKAVWLYYAGQGGRQKPLTAVKILSDDVSTKYVFKTNVNGSVGEFNDSYLQREMISITNEKYQLLKDCAVIYSNEKLFPYNQTISDTIFYSVGNHSLNWLKTYAHFITPMKSK
jgi:hypothetical protein